MATPREVIKSLALDFKRRDLSYADVARLTGYKAQSIANIISSQQKYMCRIQAVKFSDAFGYNRDYLMTGEGSLFCDEAAAGSPTAGTASFSEDSKKLALVMSAISRYIYVADDPTLLALYDNLSKLINEKDRQKAFSLLKDQERLFDMISASEKAAAPSSRK